MVVSCTVFEIMRDIGRKTPIFHTPFEFLSKIFTQTVRFPELLGGAKILPKSSSLCLEWNNVTDDRRTARCHKPNVT